MVETVVDELWNCGFRETDIAEDLGITPYHVLCLRRGKPPLPDEPVEGTETRFSTIIEGHGSFRCRRIPVTLPWSGTMQ